ncbi:N-acetylmuramoyl-L-alanine amidase [Halorhodospira sp. 9621]|uniref:N-acetylmuramoyl-L-alanine amidase n=1 Tax=Halorhodospira sp. 9621 TaxID=2899135 RepID=UPI001EE84C88|nr:N-acetylmuramoyl-L-alanine amidase [Halorhodospira sp. 9621]MCG5533582.1 N-acetylmuramoyl-L-alanine amidase [Halorhodospira sp. 9621]
MRRGYSLAWIGLLIGLLAAHAAPAATIDNVRLSDEDDRTRVVFDLDQVPEHRVFTLPDPHRVVIDFEGVELGAADLPRGGVLDGIRTGRQEGGGLRVVLDVSREVEARSFVIGGGDDGGQRLVVDLGGKQGERRQAVRSASERETREVIVAIDAGHGGVDPGAIGPDGTFEKDVVLEVSRQLYDLMKEAQGLRPLMVREGDYYMNLRDRTRVAREGNADIFLSIHADGAENPNVKGASVYALSLDGATSEQARVLARRENAADFIGGVSLEDKDDTVASVLVDLSRGHTIEASLEMGEYLLPQLDRHADLLRNRVDQAGFAVLKSLDMPSLLIELGFLTNPEEERRLNTRSYQRDLAEGIVAGVREYAERHILPELRMADAGQNGQREHEVQRGENLSVIAQRYEVSTERLREVNDLSGDQIRAGSTLVIP